jgi:RNA polymerase sigma-70 factor (sigma-E family)
MAVDSGVDPSEALTTRVGRNLAAVGFDALWERHAGRALQLAVLLCGDRSKSEDVVAEAFARVLPRWRRGAVEEFWPYLRTAVVNQVRANSRRSRSASAWRRRQPDPPASQPAEHGVAERALLGAALAGLAPMQRKALVLRYFEDLSEAEAARLLGCSVGTVKSSASRGLARLREVLVNGDRDV